LQLDTISIANNQVHQFIYLLISELGLIFKLLFQKDHRYTWSCSNISKKTLKTPKIHWHLTKERFIFSLSLSELQSFASFLEKACCLLATQEKNQNA
jgi:hypothetical protein